jgi:hypothetical protein
LCCVNDFSRFVFLLSERARALLRPCKRLKRFCEIGEISLKVLTFSNKFFFHTLFKNMFFIKKLIYISYHKKNREKERVERVERESKID